MTIGATSSRLAVLRHHRSFGHELAVTASTYAIGRNTTHAEGWKLNDRDISAINLFLILAGSCWVLTGLVITLSVVIHRARQKSTPDNDSETSANPRPFWNQPKMRQAGLIFIGFSPLMLCFLVGEYYENVVVVMVLMHNGCMILLPSLFYALRSYAEPSSRETTSSFYRAFWQNQMSHPVWKVLRGIKFGIPLFFAFMLGYFTFNCRTSKWALCVHRFEKGLEEHGLEHHSFTFRCIGLLYFTFVNPFYEEFFWRVFLHRELGMARLVIVEEQFRAKSESQGVEDAPDFSKSLHLEAMSLTPVEGVDDHPASSRSLEEDASAPEATGAYHELVDKLKVGYHCYRYALSFWKEEVEDPGLRAAIWQSIALRWGVSMMYGAYHMWPIQVIFRGSLFYTIGGFLGLSVLGRGLLLFRELQNFGIITATVVHIFVDAAFAAICLYEF